ncbi:MULTISPECIES: DUF3906 family protein [Thermoactinomyces]|jgi:hypothetical protein|uniref:DUF3906 family protein n=1 Tax=Thermoactinomyces daqus TaxID=1329516 RepID=A0A7W1XBI8_9BACL|nr:MULTISPECIES: DUF3906 family protein [Thermoactinomyces]MBA4543633.1 DUF3906 family protein [Thermoactinomyces daqus]MBH8597084.1 DUF3906 family protein [Thermoactinomyces sp. CICC 10523]MBH8602644.1 DUF3906 family protein [Thermoactinomyces sp. CICC 10522]MBH8606245.1 DUF3906 family protein [Thermoactinomyces sp. CICC 10521]
MENELYLYRLTAAGGEGKQYTIIVVSPTDEKAFQDAEKELERQVLVTPVISEWNLIEKKRIRPGSGYVLESCS